MPRLGDHCRYPTRSLIMFRKIIGGTLIWIGRTMGKLDGSTRLASNDAVPLLSTIEDAVVLYGDPLTIEQCDSFPESSKLFFRVSPFHECVLWEWQRKIHSVVFFPEYSFPDEDLNFMLETYGQGQDWDTVDEGYLYFRQDKAIRLWCSAMPPIGVATNEYWAAKESYKRKQKIVE